MRISMTILSLLIISFSASAEVKFNVELQWKSNNSIARFSRANVFIDGDILVVSVCGQSKMEGCKRYAIDQNQISKEVLEDVDVFILAPDLRLQQSRSIEGNYSYILKVDEKDNNNVTKTYAVPLSPNVDLILK
jgi:hypothetical protein